MNPYAIGIYREVEFSPGKAEADAAILDSVLAGLSSHGLRTQAIAPADFIAGKGDEAEVILAMCQSEAALRRLAQREAAGVIAINSALAIRNCYRDLLGTGLIRAGVPTPEGILLATRPPPNGRRLNGLDISAGVYVKRGDLHALGPDDVQHVDAHDRFAGTIASFARRGIEKVFVQQAVEGRVVKFYGVSDAEYFTIAEEGEVPASLAESIGQAASIAADALGLEVWGGDAIISGTEFSIVDFNDWPSFSRVRASAAAAIARRAVKLLARRTPLSAVAR